MEINSEKNGFITLKDQKQNFHSYSTTRLINLKKQNKLWRVSKVLLDTANINIWELMNLHQWRNTEAVTDWSKGIRSKHFLKFFMFDIKEFYPSFNKNVLKKFNFCRSTDTSFTWRQKICSPQENCYSLMISKLELNQWVSWWHDGSVRWSHGNRVRINADHLV